MTPNEVMALVAGVCGVKVEDMQQHCRHKETVWARYITVSLLLDDKVKARFIHKLFPLHSRINVLYRSQAAFSNLITHHKPFKRLYLESVKQLVIATGDYEETL